MDKLDRLETMLGLPYTHKELRAALDLVVDPLDWKDEINAVIEPMMKHRVEAAIVYFTATVPTFETEGDKLRVRAEGYRMGPAGDH